MSDLSVILARIEQKLVETRQSATAASKAAGKPDAIRNMQRSVKDGRRSGVSTDTLSALAKQLGTTLQWLLTGEGEEIQQIESKGINMDSLLAAVEGSYHMLGYDEQEASALLNIVLAASQEQPTPSAGPDYHRVLAETEVRKFLKSKRSLADGA